MNTEGMNQTPSKRLHDAINSMPADQFQPFVRDIIALAGGITKGAKGVTSMLDDAGRFMRNITSGKPGKVPQKTWNRLYPRNDQ